MLTIPSPERSLYLCVTVYIHFSIQMGWKTGLTVLNMNRTLEMGYRKKENHKICLRGWHIFFTEVQYQKTKVQYSPVVSVNFFLSIHSSIQRSFYLPFFHLSFCSSIHPSVHHLFIRPAIHPSIHPSNFIFIYSSVYPSVYISICPSI